jgi:hypothetical protein
MCALGADVLELPMLALTFCQPGSVPLKYLNYFIEYIGILIHQSMSSPFYLHKSVFLLEEAIGLPLIGLIYMNIC